MPKIDTEIMDYIDKKFKKLNWIVGILVLLIIVVIGTSYREVKAFGKVESRQEIMWNRYVEKEFFWSIVGSYDMQNKFLLSMEKGDTAQVEKVLKEFRQFRKEAFGSQFINRGLTKLK